MNGWPTAEYDYLFAHRTELPIEEAMERTESLIDELRREENIEYLAKALMLQAWLLNHSGNIRAAFATLNSSITFAEIIGDPLQISVLLKIKADYLSNMGLHQQALEALESCIEKTPTDADEDHMGKLRISHARILFHAGKIDESYAVFTEAISKGVPSKDPRWNELAIIFWMATDYNQPSQAIQMLKEYEKSYSIDSLTGILRSFYFDTKLVLWLREGEVEEALDFENRNAESLASSVYVLSRFVRVTECYLDAGAYHMVRQRLNSVKDLSESGDFGSIMKLLRIRLRLAEIEGNIEAQSSIRSEISSTLSKTEKIQSEHALVILQSEIESLEIQRHLAQSAEEALALESEIQDYRTKLGAEAEGPQKLLHELMALVDGCGTSEFERDLCEYGFFLVFQPCIDLRSMGIASFEVGIRLDHPTKGRLLPIEFIPRMESTGEIIEFGDWFFDHAFSAIADFSGSHERPSYFSLPIYQSYIEATDASQHIRKAALKHGVDLRNILFEIIEATAVSDDAWTQAEISNLRKIGCGFIICNFGTGYSNFARLIDFSPETIKIDRSLILGLHRGDREISAAKSLLLTGQNLDIIVTADGVDSQPIFDIVSRLGFDRAQGNLLGGFDLSPTSQRVVYTPSIDNDPAMEAGV